MDKLFVASLMFPLVGCSTVIGLDELDPVNYDGGAAASGGSGASGGTGATGATGGSGGTGAAGATGGTGGTGGTPCVVTELLDKDEGGCARLDNGDVHCWGYAGASIGLCSEDRAPLPVLAPSLDGVTAFSGSQFVSCFRRDESAVYCLGYNGNCEVASSTPMQEYCVEFQEPLPGPVTHVSVAGVFDDDVNCAISSGAVHCWGALTQVWELPLGDNSCAPPTQHTTFGLNNVKFDQVTWHACVLKEDGSASCLGSNSSGQLGQVANFEDSNLVALTVQVPPLKDLEVGAVFGVGLTPDGQVYCWGDSDEFGASVSGYACLVTPGPQGPLALDLGKPALEISAGPSHVCAVLEDRSLVCWGSNFYNEIDATEDNYRLVTPILLEGEPFLVPAAPPTVGGRVIAGDGQTCAVHESGAVYCWGINEFTNGPNGTGLLGVGSSLVKVTAPSKVLLDCDP